MTRCGCTTWLHANDPAYAVCARHEAEADNPPVPPPPAPCAVCIERPALAGKDRCRSCEGVLGGL